MILYSRMVVVSDGCFGGALCILEWTLQIQLEMTGEGRAAAYMIIFDLIRNVVIYYLIRFLSF
jgi:hypothetical protein